MKPEPSPKVLRFLGGDEWTSAVILFDVSTCQVLTFVSDGNCVQIRRLAVRCEVEKIQPPVAMAGHLVEHKPRDVLEQRIVVRGVEASTGLIHFA